MSANRVGACLALSFFAFLFLFTPAYGQDTRVANYSIGKYGAKDYETFSFWISADKRGEIEYSYRTGTKNIKVAYMGAEMFKGAPAFKIQLPNGMELHVVPKGLTLRVMDDAGKYSKRFAWMYEGPINGRGTFCDVCAEDEKEAMRIIRKYFLK